MTETVGNRLKSEKSAYLKQHQDNPVEWWPYGPEALLAAKEKNKPIFLSVGYSSCHWCHVMADESFQDQETANYLNENFINIKVDREEHPDIDDFYQKACNLFSGRGGWPLSAFLLPDSRPFYVGTYFPKEKSEGVTSFKDLLAELHRVYNDDKKLVETNASNVMEKIFEGVDVSGVEYNNPNMPHPSAILEALTKYQDNENGGYGSAPKFPTFPFYEWAIEHILEGVIGKEQGEHIVKTLENMLLGGMYDHARGGLHRYSTDDKWLIPHFEKMLYDQAGLLKVLAKFSMLYPTAAVQDAIFQTLEYLEKEMQSEQGHFFSAQDADSEGVEGLYFTYNKEELEDLIEHDKEIKAHKDNILKWTGITDVANFEGGLNVISLKTQLKDEYLTPENWEVIRKFRKLLLAERKNRIPPLTDNKGVASWNFMLISALCDLVQFSKVDAFKHRAMSMIDKALPGIFKHFIVNIPDSKAVALKHTTTKERSLPYFEDFVFFTDMNMRLYEISGNQSFKQNCIDAMKFIFKEFFKDGKAYTRAMMANEHADYPNLALNAFDSSYRSSLCSLITLSRRVRLWDPELNFSEELKAVIAQVSKEILLNPVGAGEGLRALTYPDDVYRIAKVPVEWCNNSEFKQFFAHLPVRFVFDYYNADSEENKNGNWQVCTIKECQFKGSGLKEFIQTLSPASKKDTQDA